MGKVKFHNGWLIGNTEDGCKARIRTSAIDSYDEAVIDPDGVPCPPYCSVNAGGFEYCFELSAMEALDRYFGEARNGR